MSSDPRPHEERDAAGEASVDDILASIRRILRAVESAGPEKPAHAAAGAGDDVLDLDASMMIRQPSQEPERRHAASDEAHTMSDHEHGQDHGERHADHDAPVFHDAPVSPGPNAAPPYPAPAPHSGLMAPHAAAAAASSVGDLVRTLASDRHTGVSRNGPTIEDLVREEIRPVLKEWLDDHLPPLVERLVRAEIERVVARGSV